MKKSGASMVTEIPAEIKEQVQGLISSEESAREAIMASTPVVKAEEMMSRRALVPIVAVLLASGAALIFWRRRSGRPDPDSGDGTEGALSPV